LAPPLQANYRSSTSVAAFSTGAWDVFFNHGFVIFASKNNMEHP
jgi:hypothetical protein